VAGGQIPFSGGPRLVFILMTADAVYRILDSPAVADVPSSTGHTATMTAETAAPLQRHHVDSNPTGKRLAFLTLTALGVVYGDIGTSPLYALQECFKPEHGLLPTTSNVYGVLSLIVWALISIVAIKYIVFIMRADNNGEGGILALLALIFREEREDGMAKSTLAFYTVLGLLCGAFPDRERDEGLLFAGCCGARRHRCRSSLCRHGALWPEADSGRVVLDGLARIIAQLLRPRGVDAA